MLQIPSRPLEDGIFNRIGYCETECAGGYQDCIEDKDCPLGT